MNGLLSGALAGAAGTAALNAVTYADMALRGRSGSQVPEQVVEKTTERAGVSLGEDETAENRRQALGALLGFGVGIGVGVAYGLIRSRGRTLPDALALGAAASVASEGPAVALGLTDPRTWGAAGWISDVVPHLAYGIVTAATYRGLRANR
ncbi:hypothetical protein [Actinoallomurus soli]|uniref:hypothetical protein n=1 Tax=Actinoallomurus soli TaxID=2952535 RepID=UPI0020934A9E|nr:hypothetical protein [Actinoallomurus soli]MCO5971686.1 hypothetical protein [Actinoallomurus soli]